MPTKTTDKVLLKGNIAVRICRNETAAARCSVAVTLELTPGAEATFTDPLPPALFLRPPRVLTTPSSSLIAGALRRTLEPRRSPCRRSATRNRKPHRGDKQRRSALRWAPASTESPTIAIRLVRTLISPPARESDQNPPPQSAEPLEQTLLVESADHQ